MKVITQSISSSDIFDKQVFPETVYKYRNWEGEHHRSLLEGKFYFSSPLQFNDPFDCNIPIAYEMLRDNTELQQTYFSQLLERHKPDWTKEQKDIEIKRLMKEGRFNDEEWIEWGIKRNRDNYAQNGVFCLSQNKTSILSWSHYSNSHRGFCIGFDAKKLFKYMLDNYRIAGGFVTYCEIYPQLSPISSFDEQLMTQLLHKSDHWKYEQEVRMFQLFSANKIFETPLSIITEVILGCNISDKDRTEIIDYVRTNLGHIKLYESQMVRGKFEVSFKEITL
jgi:hypothetical protein